MDTDPDTQVDDSRAPATLRTQRATLWIGISLVLIGAAAAGFSAGTVQDGTRRASLDEAVSGGVLWASVDAIDQMSIWAYVVGIAGIIVLLYRLEFFGILVSATSVAAGLAIGLAVFLPFWSEVDPAAQVPPDRADHAWFWQHAPLLLPVLWAAVALILLGVTVAYRTISARIRARQAARPRDPSAAG